MKYKIEEHEKQLDINVEDAGDKKEKLLQAFQQCQQGRCSCPTDEYKKLASLEIEDNENGLKLHIKSKPGTKIDATEINQCMEHTNTKIENE